MGLADQLAIRDPLALLTARLTQLDKLIAGAEGRRTSNGEPYPDTVGAATLVKIGNALVDEYRSKTLAGADSIGTLDRAQAIAELEAVLAVWKDPSVSDEAWLAARTGKAMAPSTAGRGVRKGRPPVRGR